MVHRTRAPAVLAEHILLTADGSDSAPKAVAFARAAIAACEPRRVSPLRVLTPPAVGTSLGQAVHVLDWAMARAQGEASIQQMVSTLGEASEKLETVVVEGRADRFIAWSRSVITPVRAAGMGK